MLYTIFCKKELYSLIRCYIDVNGCYTFNLIGSWKFFGTGKLRDSHILVDDTTHDSMTVISWIARNKKEIKKSNKVIDMLSKIDGVVVR